MPESAKVIPMTDRGGGGATATGQGAASRTREKRKKKFDATRVVTLHRDFAYQYGSEIAWDTVNRMPIKISHLRYTFGNDEVKRWMASERRRVVMPDQVVFDPSMACARECVNLYGGRTMVPKAGDVTPILELLDHLCNKDETISEYILDWVAWQMQYPGFKLPSAVIMHGDEGSGKNLFWEKCVMALHGEYGSIVGQAELESQYNPWLSKRTFIVGDEVLSRQEMRTLKGKLKSMISGKRVQISDKYIPLREEANHVNIVFLSNELQPNVLDASDRRYLVVWTPEKREREFYQRISDHADSGGLEAFLDFLLKRDLSAFDPYAPPPRTTAKDNLIDLGRPNPERFWLTWKSGELDCPFNTCSADQAYRVYRRWCGSEGEKYPMSKPVFARMVARIAKDELTVRLAKFGVSHVTRMWLLSDPPEDVDFAEFARAATDAFEAYLHDARDPANA